MPINEQTSTKAVDRGEYALRILIISSLAGLALVLVFAVATKSPLSVFGVASMVAAASMLAGLLFGFLFGIPRTLQPEQRSTAGANEKTDTAQKVGKDTDKGQRTYAPNTNLEQISDWLTKILVGAGLTQIGAIRQWIGEIANKLAPGFGSSEAAGVFATATLLYYALGGFLIGYLWTTLYLRGAMQAADVDNLARRIDEVEQQRDLDARAYALAIRQLNPSAGAAVPTQQELNETIKRASSQMRGRIFYEAGTVRSENWSEPAKKGKMERTIPLFRALIASDSDDEYHRNHAQLGYALKDQRTPDFAEAEAELTKAIQMRGAASEHGWTMYEFARAQCRILTDENFKQNKKSLPERRKKITEDLQVAVLQADVKHIVSTDDTVQRWMIVNEVQIADLEPKKARAEAA